MRRLWVKDDSGNPTHSFKDRVVAVALAAAKSLGLTTVACASTGNLAGAVAAAAARAGLRSVVLVPSDLEAGKTLGASVYGGTLVAVDGTYDDVNRLCSEVAFERTDWGFVNVTLRPFYAEGSKTVGYEVAEQLGWRLPEQVVSPIASGSLLTKVDKAWRELAALGLVEPTPYKVFGAQATGCSPVSQAFAAGLDVVQPVRPHTIAKSLAIGNPADGPYALDVVRRTGGAIADVSDEEVVEGIALLARTEGIFAETAGGVTLSVLRRLLADGLADPEAETVLLNTGDGLKTLDALAGSDVVGPECDDPPDPGRVPDRRHRRLARAARVAADRPRGRPRVSVTVRVPTILRTYTGGAAEVAVDGATLADVVAALEAAHPGIAARVLDDEGRAAPVRQRVRRRRGRPVRRRARHGHPGRVDRLGHPGGRRRLIRGGRPVPLAKRRE